MFRGENDITATFFMNIFTFLIRKIIVNFSEFVDSFIVSIVRNSLFIDLCLHTFVAKWSAPLVSNF